MGAVANDGLTTKAISPVLDGMTSTDSGRRANWPPTIMGTDDWIERVYHAGADGDVIIFVGRSYDPKRLYHHPELALLRGTETTPAGVGHTKARPDIPLHLLRTEKGGRSGIGVFALLYDGRFIENPVWFQIRTAAENVIAQRKPMTLFFASDLSGKLTNLDAAAATRVLVEAVRSFERQHSAGGQP
jgi:hypothetical protein